MGFFDRFKKPEGVRSTDMPRVPDKRADDFILELLAGEYQAMFPNEIDGKKRTHVETLLSNLGALAGFGCQMGIREALIKTGKVTQRDVFMEVQGQDGNNYYFGDFLNQPLLSTAPGRISVWSLAGGAAQQAGATELPDMEEVVAYYAQRVGTPEFFETRLPEGHRPHLLPLRALGYWPATRTVQMLHKVDPLQWGWTYALAAQKLIIKAKDIIDPALAAAIVMEAAIPMSKIDPHRVQGAAESLAA